MVVVLASENIDMERDTGCLSKGFEDVRDHLIHMVSATFSVEKLNSRESASLRKIN